jgi:hypothetical protein
MRARPSVFLPVNTQHGRRQAVDAFTPLCVGRFSKGVITFSAAALITHAIWLLNLNHGVNVNTWRFFNKSLVQFGDFRTDLVAV